MDHLNDWNFESIGPIGETGVKNCLNASNWIKEYTVSHCNEVHTFEPSRCGANASGESPHLLANHGDLGGGLWSAANCKPGPRLARRDRWSALIDSQNSIAANFDSATWFFEIWRNPLWSTLISFEKDFEQMSLEIVRSYRLSTGNLLKWELFRPHTVFASVCIIEEQFLINLPKTSRLKLPIFSLKINKWISIFLEDFSKVEQNFSQKLWR